MKFTVTIKNNETGEIIINEKCKAFFIDEQKGTKGEKVVCIKNCNISELMALYTTTIKGLKKSIEERPELGEILKSYLKSEEEK